MSKRTAAQRDKALACAVIAFLLNDWLETRFALPELVLPRPRRDPTPEGAARAVRLAWRLGDLPIANMVHLLETKGIRVYSLPRDADEVDTFSLWREVRPFIFLNTRKSAEHLRFDAHELGRLVLHRSMVPRGRQAQHQADEFASALLMPAAGLREAEQIATIDQVTQLTTTWGVSLAAVAHRLHKLGVVTDWQHRKLHDQIISPEEGRSHANGPASETSQALQTAFAALKRVRTTKREITEAVSLRLDDIDELSFGLLRTVFDSVAVPAPEPERDRPRLRLLSSRR
jgi:Zn-dependent peptidase ImmA (M78 family)